MFLVHFDFIFTYLCYKFLLKKNIVDVKNTGEIEMRFSKNDFLNHIFCLAKPTATKIIGEIDIRQNRLPDPPHLSYDIDIILSVIKSFISAFLYENMLSCYMLFKEPYNNINI